MTKLCSVCGTENREEAQFCRACGTAFASANSRNAESDGGATLNVCSECGFQNKPGLRYCANCGMSLASASADGDGNAGDSERDASTGFSPPPISYPSFAPVGPYPPAPADDHGAPDIPDPDAAIALRQQEAEETFHAATPFSDAAAPNRALFYIGIVALVLIVGGALAWTFMRESNPSPPVIGATTPPVAPTTPAASAAAAPPVVEPAPASSPAPVVTSASAVETAPATPPSTSAGALGAPPAAAQPLPQVGDPVPPETADAEAKRVAAERRRERAAREKAEREAKALTEQQNATAAQRAEQEAQARRRAEEAARARPTGAAAPPPAPVVAQPRGVREICAGRGTIAEAVCQSRQCGLPEHANEAICRQLREQDERRRNYNN